MKGHPKHALRRAAELLRPEDGFGLVEALIALTILVIGLLAVSGLTLASATQARIADWKSEQATAGQLALEAVRRQGFAAAASGSRTITVDGHEYAVTLTVTEISTKVKEVEAEVNAVGTLQARTFTTLLYQPRPLPLPPAS